MSEPVDGREAPGSSDEPRHYADEDEGLQALGLQPPGPYEEAPGPQPDAAQPETPTETMPQWYAQQPEQYPPAPDGQYPVPPQAYAEQYQQPYQQAEQYAQQPYQQAPPPPVEPQQYQQSAAQQPYPQPVPQPEQYQQLQPEQYQQAATPPPQYQQPAPQQPPAPPPLPSPEDLLVHRQPAAPAEPATWGWRGRVRRASAGLIKPKPGAVELASRDAAKRITRSFSRPMTVVVVQPKGGAGKTPTTVCLSAAFGATRGGYVVGWDDNETRGTLAVRVGNPDHQQATVWDLLSDLSAFERYDARVGDLSFYVRSQPEAHFDALVSDDNPANMAQIGDEAFQRLHTVLQRFYRLIVVDTGNNVRSPNWQAAVNAADLVVVVSTYQRDVGFSGSWVLDHLAQTGREELARNAITILTAADPTVDKAVRAQLLEHFRARTRAVTEIPYDVELAHGGPIRWTHLAPATRNAWIAAGAIVVDALAEHDDRTLAERRR